MNKQVLFKSYALLDKEEYRFTLNKGILVSISKNNKTIGFVVNKFDFNFTQLHNCIQKIESILSSPAFDWNYKIVGPQDITSDFVKLLSSLLKPKLVSMENLKIKTVIKEGSVDFIYEPTKDRIRVHSLLAPLADEKKLAHKNDSDFESDKQNIKLLIVDDSKTIRTLLKSIFLKSDKITVVGDTGDPLEVISLIQSLKPNVITLDINMPKKDGITLLKEYLKDYPIPTIMISSLNIEEGGTVLTALEIGAVDYIHKPSKSNLSEVSELLIEKIISASSARVKYNNSIINQKLISNFGFHGVDIQNSVIAIGSSTGGTEALKTLFSGFPQEIPPVVVVQHIPPVFSKEFALRLNELFLYEVKEAETGDILSPNKILIAPGGKQMKIQRSGSQLKVVIDEDAAPINRHKPSVDYMFKSLSECGIKNGVAIILTGMGQDGANELLTLKKNNWHTIAQDKESSIVFGMPAAAIELNAAEHVCSLKDIPKQAFESLAKNKKTSC